MLSDKLSNTSCSIALGLTLLCYITYLRKTNPLNKIPTVGPSGLFASRPKDEHKLVQEGYEKYRIFKFRRRFLSWIVVVVAPDLVEDMRKGTEEQISFLGILSKEVQFDHTLGHELKADDSHVRVTRGLMTRNIGPRFPDLLDEIGRTLESLLAGAEKGWVDVPAYTLVIKIVSRYTTRFFAGPELSSDSKYTTIMQNFVSHIAQDGPKLRMYPNWLRPFVSRFLFDRRGKVQEIENYLRPIIAKRVERGMDPENCDPESNDMITWLWHTAKEANCTVYDIVIRMIFLEVSSIRTTSTLLTNVIFNLATYSSYIEPLREEISTIVEAEGWSKTSIEKMRKLDSFFKESHRVHGSPAVTARRLVVNNFSFSDGTLIPRGATISLPGHAINHDKRYYEDPQEFQGFRFADKDPLKWQLTSISPEYMLFGFGRPSCPGRFFAVTEMKTVVAKILLDYDIKLADEEAGRPPNLRIGGVVEPNRMAKLSLKKRI